MGLPTQNVAHNYRKGCVCLTTTVHKQIELLWQTHVPFNNSSNMYRSVLMVAKKKKKPLCKCPLLFPLEGKITQITWLQVLVLLCRVKCCDPSHPHQRWCPHDYRWALNTSLFKFDACIFLYFHCSFGKVHRYTNTISGMYSVTNTNHCASTTYIPLQGNGSIYLLLSITLITSCLLCSGSGWAQLRGQHLLQGYGNLAAWNMNSILRLIAKGNVKLNFKS